MQPKFKKGDKIRCVSLSMAIGIDVGSIYTVSNPMYCDWGDNISIKVECLDVASPFQSRFELVEEPNKPNFKKGDMVETPLGLFEVIDMNSNESIYLCYKEGFVGHSGDGYFKDMYVRTKYQDQCWWFDEIELELVETKEQPKINYREMSPDTLVKVSIGSSEFEVSLKELLIVSDITGSITGEHRASEFYRRTQEILGNLYFDAKGEIDYGDLELDEGYLHYFEPYFSKQKEKEALKKAIETQKYILETQQALLKDLEVKYNSL